MKHLITLKLHCIIHIQFIKMYQYKYIMKDLLNLQYIGLIKNIIYILIFMMFSQVFCYLIKKL